MRQEEARNTNTGMKADINNVQKEKQEKMAHFLEDLKKVVRDYEWDFMPRDLLMRLSVKLGKNGIDEQKFALFISNEVKNSVTPIIRQGVRAQKDVSDVSQSRERSLGAAKTLEFSSEEARMARELLTIAECIKEAQMNKMSLGKYFEDMDEGEASLTIVLNRDKAESFINRVRDEERIFDKKESPIFRHRLK